MLICAAGVGLAALLYYYFTVREREGQQYAHEYGNAHEYGDAHEYGNAYDYGDGQHWRGRSAEEARRYYRAEQCSICQDDIRKRRGEPRLACGHVFHESCLEKWMEAALHRTCPNCRKPIARS
ncbi:hypothetical protein ONE63_002962 [Megalurothrips usitatus]|uniref:RING-type domain-containing protein n=1 Tax=Megalurothrips usitatus TaxID=439358 RepID=A0AAV7X9C1_9NEOP|nr:hypothetical protein ONE63_002962 [Megalurothrips usitatus]